jgi:hypothetical protein
MRFHHLMRALSLGALGSCGLAVLVARAAPRPAELWMRRESRHAAIGGAVFAPGNTSARLLDRETGRLSRLLLPDGERLEVPSFRDWIDAQEERQVVGRWLRVAPTGALVGTGLARVSYPSGRMLECESDVPTPAAPPCWYPGRVPKVLYVGTDRKLYQYTFGSGRMGGCEHPGHFAPVAWPPTAAVGRAWIEFLTWPTDTRLGGRILATLVADRGPRRLWWLRLSANGLRVEDAAPADDAGGDLDFEATMPSVGRRCDGQLVAAYLRSAYPAGTVELRVAPIEVDPSGTAAPRIAHRRARRVDVGMANSPAVFSADGHALYAFRREADLRASLSRYPLARASGR